MENNQIIEVPFAEHMKKQFIEYAKEVVSSRAIPDIRDGLKPVQRRVLVAMNDLDLHPGAKYMKSARTVGDCLGKYHPHGDSSVYGAMVTMAQDFSMRYPLVDGHGNFGSVDGDPAAAMRYTEAKLSPIGNMFLEDINKNIVDYIPNYDDSMTEPEILGTLVPQLMLNGTSGIAVGMASSFAPHMAKDVYKACDKIIEDRISGIDTPVNELIKIIKAPDFPTGGIIVNPDEVRKGYIEGNGKVVIRSRYEIEDLGRGRQAIVVTEIPFKVNKKNLVTKIAELAKETIPNISEVRDESSREGIRIVIELRKDANAELIAAMLLKKTELQATFSMNHVALVNGHPQLNLSLDKILNSFVDHAKTVCRRKIQYELGKAMEREHIVSAIVTVLQDLDDVIPLIRSSKTKKETIAMLKERYGFDEVQASAIADMRLWLLNEEGVSKYQNEHETLTEKIAAYNEILGDDIKLLTFTRSELDKRAEYFKKEKRKTEISNVGADLNVSDKSYVVDEDVIMMLTHNDIVKMVRTDDYRTQIRNGQGVSVNSKEDDFIEKIFSLRTHDDILAIMNTGRAVIYPVYKIPVVSKESKGKIYLHNYISKDPEEKIIDVIPLNAENKKYKKLFIATKMGKAKCLDVKQLPKTSAGASIIKLLGNDEVISCSLVNDDDTIYEITANGQALKVSVKTVSTQGRVSSGIKFMTFKKGKPDKVVKAFKVSEEDEVAIFLQSGLGKRMPVSVINQKKGRGGIGVRSIHVDDKTGDVVDAFVVKADETVFAVSKNGNIIRVAAHNIASLLSPAARGVKVIKINNGDSLVAVAPAPVFGEENNG